MLGLGQVLVTYVKNLHVKHNKAQSKEKFEIYNGVKTYILDELICGKKVKVCSKSMYQFENSYLTGSL